MSNALVELAKSLVSVLDKSGCVSFISWAPNMPVLSRLDSIELLKEIENLRPAVDIYPIAIYNPSETNNKNDDIVERILIGTSADKLWTAWIDNYKTYLENRVSGADSVDRDSEFARINNLLAETLESQHGYKPTTSVRTSLN